MGIDGQRQPETRSGRRSDNNYPKEAAFFIRGGNAGQVQERVVAEHLPALGLPSGSGSPRASREQGERAVASMATSPPCRERPVSFDLGVKCGHNGPF